MPIELNREARAQAVASIERYFSEELDQRIGNIGAGALLSFFLEEIGPLVYNQAVSEVQERLLRLFAAYARGFGDRHVTVERLYDWCRSASSQNVARDRFDHLRRFCLYAHAEDRQHRVPPAGVFGRGKRRRPTPHIIEPEQVQAIMQAADECNTHVIHTLDFLSLPLSERRSQL